MSNNYHKYSLNSDSLTDTVLNDYMCMLGVLWFVCVSVFEFACPHACVGMCAQMYGGEGLMSVRLASVSFPQSWDFKCVLPC